MNHSTFHFRTIQSNDTPSIIDVRSRSSFLQNNSIMSSFDKDFLIELFSKLISSSSSLSMLVEDKKEVADKRIQGYFIVSTNFLRTLLSCIPLVFHSSLSMKSNKFSFKNLFHLFKIIWTIFFQGSLFNCCVILEICFDREHLTPFLPIELSERLIIEFLNSGHRDLFLFYYEGNQILRNFLNKIADSRNIAITEKATIKLENGYLKLVHLDFQNVLEKDQVGKQRV